MADFYSSTDTFMFLSAQSEYLNTSAAFMKVINNNNPQDTHSQDFSIVSPATQMQGTKHVGLFFWVSFIKRFTIYFYMSRRKSYENESTGETQVRAKVLPQYVGQV